MGRTCSTSWHGVKTIGRETTIWKTFQTSFWVQEVEYFGHIVSHECLKVDPNKIKDVKEWSIPKTLKNLIGFLILTGYYCKFVKNYGKITTLLNKDAFSWSHEETQDFEKIKEARCRIHVLATIEFTKTFIMECDTSGHGIGVVLMQEGIPLSFKIC